MIAHVNTRRVLVVLGPLGALVTGYLAMQAVYALHVAHALGDVPNGIATSPGFSDPAAHPLEAATSAWSMVHQYGWIWGAMIVVGFAGAALMKDLEGNHWLHATWGGRVYLALVGLTGTAAAAVQAHFGATTWAGVATTAISAVLLLITPPKPATP